MTNEIVKTSENKDIVVDYKEVAKTWLTNTGTKLNSNQMNQFIEMCQAFSLNPIKREVYAVAYGSNFNIIVGYEVYLKRAERSGKLSGWKVWTEGSEKELKACIEINRRDWSAPFVHEVYFSEYFQNTAIWKNKPRTMLKKVAIAQGFRLCFPDELGGMPYTSDELPIPEKEINAAVTVTSNIEPQQPKEEAKKPVEAEKETKDKAEITVAEASKRLNEWLVQYDCYLHGKISDFIKNALEGSDNEVLECYERAEKYLDQIKRL